MNKVKARMQVCGICFEVTGRQDNKRFNAKLLTGHCADAFGLSMLRNVDSGELFIDVSKDYKPCSCRKPAKN